MGSLKSLRGWGSRGVDAVSRGVRRRRVASGVGGAMVRNGTAPLGSDALRPRGRADGGTESNPFVGADFINVCVAGIHPSRPSPPNRGNSKV